MFTAAQVFAAAPLMLTALIAAVMVPASERLVLFRIKRVYSDFDGVRFSLDLYSTATLAIATPLIGLAFVPNVFATGIFALYLVILLVNLVAIILVVTTRDVHVYVAKRRFLLWSYPTWMSLVAMIGAGALSAVFVS